MCSSVVEHYIEPWQGHRRAVVSFTKENVLDWLAKHSRVEPNLYNDGTLQMAMEDLLKALEGEESDDEDDGDDVVVPDLGMGVYLLRK